MELRHESTHTIEELRRSHDNLSHHLRALSHDMTANFMLLESSFSQLKRELADPAAPVEMTSAFAHVEACLRESKRFLDDLRDLARKGNVTMEPGCVELSGVVDEVLFEQRQLLSGRGVRVEVKHPLAAVWCNRHRLKQVLSNLVRNALKHGCDAKWPRIVISAASEPNRSSDTANRGRVAIRVHDNGPGIDPRYHEEIFLPGRRLADATGDGCGMGLAIVKRVVQLYGGAVWVESPQGEGTTLVVLLPSSSSEGVLECRTTTGSPLGPDPQGHTTIRDHLDDDHRLRPHRPRGRRSSRHRSP